MARAMSKFRCRSRKNASPQSARSRRPSRSSSARKAASTTARSTTSRSPCTTCGTGSETCSSREPDPACPRRGEFLQWRHRRSISPKQTSAGWSRSKTPLRRSKRCLPPGGQPSTSNLPRQRARLAGGAFNLMGAAYGAKGVHGLKAYAGVKGAQFHSLLYSSLDGKLKAIIEADLLGQMRTGAASGVATKLLAKADAHTLAVIGTGKQSRTQIAAVCAVRPITRVKVFSRTAEHREAYARAVEKELGVQALPASSAQACVAEADVVVTITNSAEPVCRAQWLAEGAHVNVAGA